MYQLNIFLQLSCLTLYFECDTSGLDAWAVLLAAEFGSAMDDDSVKTGEEDYNENIRYLFIFIKLSLS